MTELDRRLREAGQAPVPAPDPAFATMLEDRLRAGVLAPEPAFRPGPRSPRRAWQSRFPMAVAAVAAALVMVLGAVAVLRGGDEEREVRVASATDTVIVLPDGTVGPATPGLVIPDGSRLQTGSEGHVVAGETELGPKQEAKVRSGTVKASPTTVPPRPSEPSNPPATAPTATTLRPVEPGDPGPPPPGGATTTTAPTTPSTATPRPTKPPVVSPSTKPTRPTDTKPTTTTSRPATNTPAALKLEARSKGETVELRWSAYTGRDFAAYLVLRADGPSEPGYPVDENTTVVARITDPSATSFMETIADPANRVYRVVAVDSERRLLAQSAAVKPQPFA